MQKISFELVDTINGVRVYKASHVLSVDVKGTAYKDCLQAAKEAGIKSGFEFMFYKDSTKTDTVSRTIPHRFKYLAVSDALTHMERLVFPAWRYNSKVSGKETFIWDRSQVAGEITFVIHGGNAESVKPDAEYLKQLAKANGYDYKG